MRKTNNRDKFSDSENGSNTENYGNYGQIQGQEENFYDPYADSVSPDDGQNVGGGNFTDYSSETDQGNFENNFNQNTGYENNSSYTDQQYEENGSYYQEASPDGVNFQNNIAERQRNKFEKLSTDELRKRIIYSAFFVLFILVAVAPAFAWPLVTFLFSLVISLELSYEYASAISKKNKNVSVLISIISAALCTASPALVWLLNKDFHRGWNLMSAEELGGLQMTGWKQDFLYFTSSGVAFMLLFAFVFSVLYLTLNILRGNSEKFKDLLVSLSSMYYVGVPLGLINVMLFAVPNGYIWMMMSIILPCVTDVAAFLVGSQYGVRPFFNKLSPNKTAEGASAGIFTAVIFTILVNVLFMTGEVPTKHGLGFSLVFGIVSGLIMGICAEAGDLYASGIKRRLGIKDFSGLLGAMGGGLDRFDSILFTIPACFLSCCVYYII